MTSIAPNSFLNLWPNFVVVLISVSSCNCDDREQCFRNRIINKIATTCTFGPLRTPSWALGTSQWQLSLASALVIHTAKNLKLYFWSSAWPQMSKHVLLHKCKLHENSSQLLLSSLLKEQTKKQTKNPSLLNKLDIQQVILYDDKKMYAR